MLIAAISNVLYTYYVSRLGPDAIAAVSLVFPIALVAMTAMSGGLGGGAASAIARALGARRVAAATATAEHAFLLAASIGVLFALLILAIGHKVMGWMGGEGPVLEQATAFSRVLFGGSIITFMGGMFDSVLRGEGNVRVPAIWSSSSLGLQILLTPLFMFKFGLGLEGAALSALVSQLLATFPRAWYVLGGRGAIKPRAFPRRIALEPLKEILRIGIPASVSTTINYVGIMILTGVVARLGTPDLAAYGLGTRLDFLLLSFAFGVSAAVLTLVGLAIGAGRTERVGEYVRAACLLIVGLLGLAGGLLWWRPALWMGIFTHDAGILAVGATYFRVVGPSYPFVGLSMVLVFAFQGLGRATPPLIVMAVRMPVVLVLALWCVRAGLGEGAVFATIAAGNVLSSLVMAGLFVRELRRRTGGAATRLSEVA